MATLVDSSSESDVSLVDFLEYLKANASHLRNGSLLSASEMLIRLSRNPAFLGDFLLEVLRDKIGSGRAFGRMSRIFKVAQVEDLILRALVWEPVTGGVDGSQFFYNIPHDHDFDFLTVCCFGSGLASELFLYDNEAVLGKKGEPVAISHEGTITLRPGKALLFEAGKDIHIQLPPDDLCITLNIMGPKRVEKGPFWFDIEKSCIANSVDHTESLQSLLIKASRWINDGETVEHLTQIRNENPALASLANEVLVALSEQRNG